MLYDGQAIEAPATPDTSKAVELESFVPGVELSHVEKSYTVNPGKGGEQGYSILHAALTQTDTMAVGTVLLDKAPKLVALEAVAGGLRMHTLRYADSFRVEKADRLIDADSALVSLAVQLVEAKRAESVDLIEDTYAAALRDAIGGKVAPAPTTPDDAAADILESLRATVDQAKPKSARKRAKATA